MKSQNGDLILSSTLLTTSTHTSGLHQHWKPRRDKPYCYQEFMNDFRKTKATGWPSHRPYNCGIELLPSTMAPQSRIYPLLWTDHRATEDYLQEALQQGYICPATCYDGIFFVEKKDGALWACIDYEDLNNISVKCPYPPPLVLSALEQLRCIWIFTKLDLCSAYNWHRQWPLQIEFCKWCAKRYVGPGGDCLHGWHGSFHQIKKHTLSMSDMCLPGWEQTSYS